MSLRDKDTEFPKGIKPKTSEEDTYCHAHPAGKQMRRGGG